MLPPSGCCGACLRPWCPPLRVSESNHCPVHGSCKSKFNVIAKGYKHDIGHLHMCTFTDSIPVSTPLHSSTAPRSPLTWLAAHRLPFLICPICPCAERISNLSVLSMAGTLLHLLTQHSAFMPTLLAGEEASDQLPPQAAQMQVPITSLLPLVEAQPHESQVSAPFGMRGSTLWRHALL